MTKIDKLKLVILIVIYMGINMLVFGQSIAINNSGAYMLELGDEEKAIKTSSSLIKAKTDVEWFTEINSQQISWKVKYNKDTKMYLLYKQGLKYYESSTIAGVRSKYASDLLGREIKIQ